MYIPARHLAFIAKRLDAIECGMLKRLMVFLPPRHSKSMTISETFPSWFIGKNPERRVIEVSYGDSLARRFGRLNRQKIEEFGPELFGVEVSQGNASVTNWGIKGHHGGMLSAGIGAGITGMGADLMVVDDVVKNRQEANSLTYRDMVWSEWQSTLLTRLQPGGAVIIVLCMTGNTPVLMTEGGERCLGDIRPGDMVASYDDGVLVPARVLQHRSNGVDRVFRIRTVCGRQVTANARHPFLVDIGGGRLRWIRLKDLNTAHRIVTVRDSGGNGGDKLVQWMAATGQSVREGIAPLITIRSGGPTGTGHLVNSTPSADVWQRSSIDTALRSLVMRTWLLPREATARFVASLQEIMCVLTGGVSYALTTTTAPGKYAPSCATTVTWPLVMPKRSRQLWQLPRISDFTTTGIVSIELAGLEEVYDIEVERTGNFIANGLVSHNTRWHADDIAGRLLAAEPGEWEVVCFPAEAEENDLLGREVGEPLWPGFGFDHAWMADKKREVGSQAWAALYQQRPSPGEGGMLKRDWWKFYRQAPAHFDEVIQSWDCAVKDQGSYVVGQVWGRVGADKYLLDQVRARVDITGTMTAIRSLSAKWPETHKKLIEDKANGPAVVQMLKREIPGLVAVQPQGGKEVRVQASMPDIEAGNVYLPEPAIASWVHDFIEECAAFPAGVHDDQVDAMTQALQALVSKPIEGW